MLVVRSSVEALAQSLRDEILDGRLAPGQPIPQEEISARFGVSRSPLREALRQLEAEGMVEYRANRGAIVASMDARIVRQVYQLRRILELSAIELAIEHIDAATIAELRRLDASLRKERDSRAFIRMHHEFHQRIYEATENPLLAKAIGDHAIKAVRVPDVHRIAKAVKACCKLDHAHLLNAIARREVDRARVVTRKHLDHIEAIILAALASHAAKRASTK
jgi:DNA-binding GntR family transcriptional regulator